jgi:hypothetical protein
MNPQKSKSQYLTNLRRRLRRRLLQMSKSQYRIPGPFRLHRLPHPLRTLFRFKKSLRARK